MCDDNDKIPGNFEKVPRTPVRGRPIPWFWIRDIRDYGPESREIISWPVGMHPLSACIGPGVEAVPCGSNDEAVCMYIFEKKTLKAFPRLRVPAESYIQFSQNCVSFDERERLWLLLSLFL